MKNPQLHITLTAAKLAQIEEQAELLGVSPATVGTVVMSAFAEVQPVKLFPALGSIPESYRRPKSRAGKTA